MSVTLLPRLQDVLQTLQVAVTNALNTAAIETPAQVVIGWPVATELIKINNQGQYQVSIVERSGTARSVAGYNEPAYQVTSPYSPLAATVVGNVVTFSGSVVPGLNVHTFVGAPVADAYYQTISGDTLATVATGAAAAITALALAGITAAAVGAAITVTGSPLLICNVGGVGTVMAKENGRIARSIQVTAWCPNPDIRWLIAEAIISAIGTQDNRLLTLSDGTTFECLLTSQASKKADGLDDKSQSSYSLYQESMVFDVEYAMLRYFGATTIESGIVQSTVNSTVEVAQTTPGLGH